MIPKELHSVDYGIKTYPNATEKRPEMRKLDILSSNFRVKYTVLLNCVLSRYRAVSRKLDMLERLLAPAKAGVLIFSGCADILYASSCFMYQIYEVRHACTMYMYNAHVKHKEIF